VAEPSLEYQKRISGLFCEKYNELNKTNFTFDGIEKKPCDVDFYIKDGDNRIPIQYSKIESIQHFYKSSAQTYNATQRLEQMAKSYGFKCSISIVFKNVPLNKDDINRFVRCCVIFLRYHLKEEKFKLRFIGSNDLDPLKGIFEYLSEFEILSTGGSNFRLFIGNEKWGYSRTVDEEVAYYLERISEKDAKYSRDNDIILLFDMDPMPVTDISLDELRKSCNLIKFNCKEIWQINLGNQGFCDKIYPFDKSD
jgi:hypothetical protein